jgi:mono/diheme cytochrome c family protein
VRLRDDRTLQITLGVVGVFVLVAAGLIGYVIGNSGEQSSTSSVNGMMAGAQQGQDLPVQSIGDPQKGAQLFSSMGCSSCHSYGGSGGTDAPPLDFMKGKLSPSEVADMSGIIWNHVPGMLPHFKEEGVPFPTFSGNQMADLIAYLHGGGPGVKPTPGQGMGGGMMGKQGGGMGGGMMGTQSGGGGTNGQALFIAACGTCHTLSAAGTSGTFGPDLDLLKPTEQVVLKAIATGPGAMPSGIYSGAQAKAVAKYVSQSAGK